MKGKRGFTLVELLIVISIIGLLAAVVMPKLARAKHNARATQIVGAMRAIRIGATMYNDSAGQWPPDAAPGVIPAGLEGYLPGQGGGLFSSADWQVRWRLIPVSGGPSQALIIAEIEDPNLCPPLAALMGGASGTVAVACNVQPGRVTQTVER